MTFPNTFARSGKFNNRKCKYKGIKFDSERERDRFIFLQDCERRGLISELKHQVLFTLIPDEYADVPKQLKTKVRMERRRTFIGVRYKADFVYYHVANKCHVVEDVKINPKVIPKEFELKEKMMWYFHRIKIQRVYKPNQSV